MKNKKVIVNKAYLTFLEIMLAFFGVLVIAGSVFGMLK